MPHLAYADGYVLCERWSFRCDGGAFTLWSTLFHSFQLSLLHYLCTYSVHF